MPWATRCNLQHSIFISSSIFNHDKLKLHVYCCSLIFSLFQVGKFLQLLVTFSGSIVIAFVKGWRLTLVLLSAIPAMVISGAIMGLTISMLASRGQASYSAAANVVEQTIGSIRTVCNLSLKDSLISFLSFSLNYNPMTARLTGCIIHRGEESS